MNRGAGLWGGLMLAGLLLAPTLARSGETARAPGFRLRTIDGRTLELGELLKRGPVLLDFWATWCKPCVTSLPEVDALSRTYGPRGLSVVGISIDGPRNESRIRPFVARFKLSYPIGIDEDGHLQTNYRVKAIPTAVLIDRDGTIRSTRAGYLPGEGDKLRATLDALLPQPAGADTTLR